VDLSVRTFFAAVDLDLDLSALDPATMSDAPVPCLQHAVDHNS
jgi:hypothetical protein